jgi:hypothetical protein
MVSLEGCRGREQKGSPAEAAATEATGAKPRFRLSDAAPLGLSKAGAVRMKSDVLPGRVLRTLWVSSGTSTACVFTAAGKPMANCAAARLSENAAIIPAADEFGAVYAWDEETIVDAGAGTRLARLKSPEGLGWVRKDGSVFVATAEPGGLYEVRGADVKPLASPLPRSRTFLSVLPGWVIWGEGDIAKGFSLALEKPSAKDVITLGSAPKEPRIKGCWTGKGELVVVMESSAEVRVFFPDAAAFAPAVTHVVTAADQRTEFGCAPDGSPRWLWMKANQLHDVSCRRTGCKASSSKPISLGDPGELSLAPFGEASVILAYESEGVRVRIAPVTDVAAATDTWLVAEKSDGVFVFGRGDMGWLAIRAGQHTYAFRLERNAEIQPVGLEDRL